MAIIITKEIKKKRILLAVAGVMLLTAFLIIYFGIFYNPSVPAVDVLVPASGVTGSKSEISDINVGIFEDQRFKDLQIPPGVPIATDTPGKANPFSD